MTTERKDTPPAAFAITVLVENKAGREGLDVEHGLSFRIETDDYRVLVDTGQTDAVVRNASALGVDLARTDAIVLTHGHYDHTGGLAAVRRVVPEARVVAHPDILRPRWACLSRKEARYIGIPESARKALERAPRVEWTTVATEFLPGLHVTGEIPRINDFEDVGGPFFLDAAATTPDKLPDDQAVYFDTDNGLMLLLGCAHSGVVNTMRHVAGLTGRDRFHCVMGGMHLAGASRERVEQTLLGFEEFHVDILAPCHCTGERAVARMRERFAGRVVPCHGGDRFRF